MRALQQAFRQAALRRALCRGDVGHLQRAVAAGADPVVLYDRARALRRPHAKSLDFLEQEIEDAAVIHGTHVSRHQGWKIKR